MYFELTTFKRRFRDRIVVRECSRTAVAGNFEALVREINVRALAHGQAPSCSQRVYDKSDIMFVSKNIVRTSMREDVFGEFA
jgi:hypothetical protein